MENRTILLYFAVAAMIMIGLATVPRLLDADLPIQPTVATTATILEIKGKAMIRSGSPYAYVRIIFRSPKGLIGRDSRDLHQLNCRVGDVVKAYQEGADLFLDGDACTTHRANPQHS